MFVTAGSDTLRQLVCHEWMRLQRTSEEASATLAELCEVEEQPAVFLPKRLAEPKTRLLAPIEQQYDYPDLIGDRTTIRHRLWES